MGIFIRLSQPGQRTAIPDKREMWEDYSSVLQKSLDFYAPFFRPTAFEHWLNAPSETMSGKLLTSAKVERNTSPIPRNVPRDYEESIVRIKGKWTIGKAVFAGHFSAHMDREWRAVYGDFEIDGYYHAPGGDLSDAIWDNGLTDSMVEAYFDAMRGFRGNVFELASIFVTPSPSGERRLDLARALYSTNITEFYSAMLRSLRAAEEEDLKEEIEERTTAYQEVFLINTIRKYSEAANRIARAFQKHGIKSKQGSVVYIGANKDSFQRVYAEMAESVFLPAIRVLPTKKTLQESVWKAITKQKELRTE